MGFFSHLAVRVVLAMTGVLKSHGTVHSELAALQDRGGGWRYGASLEDAYLERGLALRLEGAAISMEGYFKTAAPVSFEGGILCYGPGFKFPGHTVQEPAPKNKALFGRFRIGL